MEHIVMNEKGYVSSKNEADNRQPYGYVGAGTLTATVEKDGDERRGWQYRFNIYHTSESTGEVSQWLSPKDVESLARLTQVLSHFLADDGCMDRELRDDLFCLASCLDDVIGPLASVDKKFAITAVEAEAIKGLVDHLWEEEPKFRADPTKVQLAWHLQVLKQWLSSSLQRSTEIVEHEQ